MHTEDKQKRIVTVPIKCSTVKKAKSVVDACEGALLKGFLYLITAALIALFVGAIAFAGSMVLWVLRCNMQIITAWWVTCYVVAAIILVLDELNVKFTCIKDEPEMIHIQTEPGKPDIDIPEEWSDAMKEAWIEQKKKEEAAYAERNG